MSSTLCVAVQKVVIIRCTPAVHRINKFTVQESIAEMCMHAVGCKHCFYDEKKYPRMLYLKQRGIQALCPSCFYAKYYNTQASVVYDMSYIGFFRDKFLSSVA